jgi:hypothetical protein
MPVTLPALRVRPGFRDQSAVPAHEGPLTADLSRIPGEADQLAMVPAMKSSTACFASLSEYCTGGDFMK